MVNDGVQAAQVHRNIKCPAYWISLWFNRSHHRIIIIIPNAHEQTEKQLLHIVSTAATATATRF